MKANMIVDIKYLPEFERRAKKMAKKYRSFIEDYDKFLGSLEENPFQGTSLDKTRMAVLSKGKGKSGGVRVLTYTVQKVNPEKIVITLLSIFDKSDIENVSDGYIKSLVKEVKNQYED